MSLIGSLYGGLPGRSFILKARFDSVADMYDAFKKGPDYTDAWYGEYVVIDTPNKNNPDNGKIFRRGEDYLHKNDSNEHDGGAEYIGQFVGTASGTPYFGIGDLDFVKEQINRELDFSVYEERAFPETLADGGFKIHRDNMNENGNDDLPHTEIWKGDFSQKTPIADGSMDAAYSDSQLIPGKEYVFDEKGKPVLDENGNQKVKYNDSIKYTWCNIRTNNTTNDSWYYVGFQFPYPVVEFDAVSKHPYDSKTRLYDSDPEIVRDDDKKHPFYRHYMFKVPHGVKGDSLQGLYTDIASTEKQVWLISELMYDDTTGALMVPKTPGFTASLKTPDSVNRADTTPTGKRTETNEDHKSNHLVGDHIVLYDITSFSWIDQPGEKDHDPIDRDQYICPDKITVYVCDQDEVRSAEMAYDGSIVLWLNTNYAITIKENDGTTDFQIKFIDDIKLSPDDKLLEDKRIHVRYNTDVILNPDGTKAANQPAYNSANSRYHQIGDSINYVQEIVIDQHNYHLMILFNDKNHRYPNAPGSDQVVNIGNIDPNMKVTQSGEVWVRRINLQSASKEIQDLLGWDRTTHGYKQNATLADQIWWRDYGAVKDQSGVLCGLNVSNNTILESMAQPTPGPEAPHEAVIEYLNNKYPIGLTGDTTHDGTLTGKIVTVGDHDWDRRFYAFDYDWNVPNTPTSGYKGWYFLGKTNDNDKWDAQIWDLDGMREVDYNDFLKNQHRFTNELTVHGVMLIAKDYDLMPEIPSFWDGDYSMWGDNDYRWRWGYLHEDGVITQ